MIYETDLIKALTERIKKFTKVKVENQDIKNCLKDRPCFFIRSIQTVDTQTASNYELNSFSFEIIYFATENNKGYLELLQTKRFLKAILNKPLKITKNCIDSNNNIENKTYFVELDSLSSTINEDDYVLNCVLEIKIEQSIDYSDIASQFAVDLDSENITDDADFNREILEGMDADFGIENTEINTFGDE